MHSHHRNRMRFVSVTHRIIALSALFFVSGCGMVDIEPRPKVPAPSFTASIDEANEQDTHFVRYKSETHHRADPRLIGRVTISPAKGSSLEGMSFEIRKIPKGYAAETRLFESEPLQTNFTLSADKENKFMAGIVFKIKF